MGPLDGRDEFDLRACFAEAATQVDVLDRRVGIALLIEASRRRERRTPHRPEPGPEGVGRPRARLVHVVVQEVAEDRHGAACARHVVVGAEDRVELRARREYLTDLRERARVDLDVGVDEHEHLAGRARRTCVAGSCGGQGPRRLDDDDLVRRVVRRVDRAQATGERLRSIGRGDDHGQGHHGPGAYG